MGKSHKIKFVGIIIKQGDLFLGVSRKDDFNSFTLPGGKVEAKETLSNAIIRELLEETGLVLCALELVAVSYITKEAIFLGQTKETVFCYDEPHLVKWVEKEILLKGIFGDRYKKLFRLLKM